MERVKKIAAIHDLSGIGRCSLGAVLPILSVMGVQVCSVPTAVLSTHTGGYEGYSFLDCTDQMPLFKKHWEALGVEFDCIYSGFLGSSEQIDIVCDFIDSFKKENTLVIVDPAFADNGKLYDTFDESIVKKMRSLIKKADIITPNVTEAAFLAGEELLDSYKEDDVLRLFKALGVKTSVITSVLLYDKFSVCTHSQGSFFFESSDYIPREYPGTGDTFASLLSGFLLRGESLTAAIKKSVEFLSYAIDLTYRAKTPEREGILLESALPKLFSMLK